MDPAHSNQRETMPDAAGISTSAVSIDGAATESSRSARKDSASAHITLLNWNLPSSRRSGLPMLWEPDPPSFRGDTILDFSPRNMSAEDERAVELIMRSTDGDDAELRQGAREMIHVLRNPSTSEYEDQFSDDRTLPISWHPLTFYLRRLTMRQPLELWLPSRQAIDFVVKIRNAPKVPLRWFPKVHEITHWMMEATIQHRAVQELLSLLASRGLEQETQLLEIGRALGKQTLRAFSLRHRFGLVGRHLWLWQCCDAFVDLELLDREILSLREGWKRHRIRLHELELQLAMFREMREMRSGPSPHGVAESEGGSNVAGKMPADVAYPTSPDEVPTQNAREQVSAAEALTPETVWQGSQPDFNSDAKHMDPPSSLMSRLISRTEDLLQQYRHHTDHLRITTAATDDARMHLRENDNARRAFGLGELCREAGSSWADLGERIEAFHHGMLERNVPGDVATRTFHELESMLERHVDAFMVLRVQAQNLRPATNHPEADIALVSPIGPLATESRVEVEAGDSIAEDELRDLAREVAEFLPAQNEGTPNAADATGFAERHARRQRALQQMVRNIMQHMNEGSSDDEPEPSHELRELGSRESDDGIPTRSIVPHGAEEPDINRRARLRRLWRSDHDMIIAQEAAEDAAELREGQEWFVLSETGRRRLQEQGIRLPSAGQRLVYHGEANARRLERAFRGP